MAAAPPSSPPPAARETLGGTGPGLPGRRIVFDGIPLRAAQLAETADWIAARAGAPDAGSPTILVHINAFNHSLLQRRPDLKSELAHRAVCFLDGIGMKAAAGLAGFGRVPDLNGTDLFPLVMERAASERLRVYFLGSEAPVVAAALRATAERFPGVRLVGGRQGFFSKDEGRALAREIGGLGVQLLLVGCGFVKQEEFALEHAAALKARAIWCVGGLFDFVSGRRPRAPRALRRLRLEWAFRLALEPRRLWRRSVVAAPCVLARAVLLRAEVLADAGRGAGSGTGEVPR